jgi:hypothetical protein
VVPTENSFTSISGLFSVRLLGKDGLKDRLRHEKALKRRFVAYLAQDSNFFLFETFPFFKRFFMLENVYFFLQIDPGSKSYWTGPRPVALAASKALKRGPSHIERRRPFRPRLYIYSQSPFNPESRVAKMRIEC